MKKANILYCDPPWSFRNEKTGGSMKSGSANQYNVMNQKDLALYPINDLIQDDCICFMWVTSPMQLEAFELLSAWGFDYKASMYWIKIGKLGMGYWVRNQVEILYIGTRGNVPAMRSSHRNIYHSKVECHSKKPDWFRKFITRETIKLFDKPVRLELFARQRYPLWQSIGDQL